MNKKPLFHILSILMAMMVLCMPMRTAASASALTVGSKTISSEPLSITTSSLPKATVGEAYSTIIHATGSVPISFNIYYNPGGTNEFPEELSLSSSGQITGTPVNPGSYTFYVNASNSEEDIQRKFTLIVEAASTPTPMPTPTLPPMPTSTPTLDPMEFSTDTMLPSGMVGEGYDTEITINQDCLVSFTVYYNPGGPNEFPDALVLNANGHISGTPDEAGTYEFYIAAQTDTEEIQQKFVLTINEGAVAPGGALPTGLIIGVSIVIAMSVVWIIVKKKKPE